MPKLFFCRLFYKFYHVDYFLLVFFDYSSVSQKYEYAFDKNYFYLKYAYTFLSPASNRKENENKITFITWVVVKQIQQLTIEVRMYQFTNTCLSDLFTRIRLYPRKYRRKKMCLISTYQQLFETCAVLLIPRCVNIREYVTSTKVYLA